MIKIMSNQYHEDFEKKLFPILSCPQCKSSQLETAPRNSESWSANVNLYKDEIICSQCNASYPITDDFIPVMWTAPIKQYLVNHTEKPTEAVAANMMVYDSISDNYNKHSRRNQELETRVLNCAKKLLNTELGGKKQYHLDFGCGPGHVLGWLKELDLTQVGLDVSLVNLRNARRQTGALVVCGDASNMPFVDSCFDLVTESSALHHIADWRSCVKESCRVTKQLGGVLLDTEPSAEQMDWSWIAIKLFESRFIPYQFLSYLLPNSRFYLFRDRKEAKINMLAEIHHQPKTGFAINEVKSLFSDSGLESEVILSPSSDLRSVPNPSKQHILISILSLRNPWDAKYQAFTALATKSLKH
jgi:ubiquinone/menaquinone biosynthesis C-methylase UbiE/uncharacterized protein YbaR (Trm112 family)